MNRELDKLRKSAGLTVECMADSVGISTIEAIEMLNGLTAPPKEYVNKWKILLLNAYMRRLNDIQL